jgi:hypothetical protein
MSIWKDFGDDRDEFFNSDEELRLNHEEFDQWLDSINESNDAKMDEKYYNKEVEYPEIVVESPNYKMTYSNN